MNNSPALRRWRPGDADTRLGQELGTIRRERGITDMRLRFQHAILIENEIRSPALCLVPAVRRFEAESEPQFKIRPQPQRILRKPCPFERAPSEFGRGGNDRERGNSTLQKCAQAPERSLP